jgi:hypothetical protein
MFIRLLSNSLCFVVLLIAALFLVNSFFGRYNCSRMFLTIATIFSGSLLFQRNRTELQEFHSYYYKKRRNVKFVNCVVNLVYFFCHLGFVLLLVMVEVMVVIAVVVVVLRERFFCVWFHMFQVLQFGVRFLNFMLPPFRTRCCSCGFFCRLTPSFLLEEEYHYRRHSSLITCANFPPSMQTSSGRIGILVVKLHEF